MTATWIVSPDGDEFIKAEDINKFQTDTENVPDDEGDHYVPALRFFDAKGNETDVWVFASERERNAYIDAIIHGGCPLVLGDDGIWRNTKPE